MLSRRRSSVAGERRRSRAPGPLDAVRDALRAYNVLCWVAGAEAAEADGDERRVPRFSREGRERRAQGSGHMLGAGNLSAMLVVAEAKRNPGALRVHKVLDYGRGGAVRVQKSWNVSELRRIDGMGGAAGESVKFALLFGTNTRPVVWDTETPRARARFLWALLQLCVARLKRAPPAVGLRLLELQKAAEAPEVRDDVPPQSERSGVASGVSASNAAGVAEIEPGVIGGVMLPESTPSDSVDQKHRISEAEFAAPGKKDEVVCEEEGLVAAKRAQDLSFGIKLPMRQPSTAEADAANHRPVRLREQPKYKRVLRTVSEPQASVLYGRSESSGSSSDESGPLARRPETLAASTAAHPDARIRAMNMDERAFLVAANRLGGKRFAEGFAPAEPRLADATDGANWERPHLADGTTAKIVADRRLQEERKLFRLTADESRDLNDVLDTFFFRQDDTAPLSSLSTWAEAQVHALESTNMSETVNVEMDSVSRDFDSRSREDIAPGNLATPNGAFSVGQESADPLHVLSESVGSATSWLEKCEVRLAPYASLVSDIRGQMRLLDVQRENVADLQVTLSNLLERMVLSSSQERNIQGIITNLRSGSERAVTDDVFLLKTVVPAALVLANKANYMPKATVLLDIAAVISGRQKVLAIRDSMLSVLLPVIQSRISRLHLSYGSPSPVHSNSQSFASCLSLSVPAGITDNKTTFPAPDPSFCMEDATRAISSATCAASALNKSSTKEIYVYYEDKTRPSVSAALRVLQSHAQGCMTSSLDHPPRRQSQTCLESFFEGLLALHVMEGVDAHHLFASSTSKQQNDSQETIFRVLEEQFVDVEEVLHAVVERVAKGDVCAYWTVFHRVRALGARLSAEEPDRILSIVLDYEWVRIQGRANSTVEAAEARLGPASAFALLDGPSSVGTSDSFVSAPAMFSEMAQGDVSTGSLRYLPATARSPATSSGASFGSTTASLWRKKQQQQPQSPHHMELADVESSGCLLYFKKNVSAMAEKYSRIVEQHVGELISSASVKRDVVSENDRTSFFTAVKALIDLCCNLISSDGSAGSGKSDDDVSSSGETLALCERLVAAAMKNTEGAASGQIGVSPDLTKLQCYAYIAARLRACKQTPFMEPLAALAVRGRKHVLARWTEQQLLRVHFGELFSAVSAPSVSARQQVQIAIGMLNARRVASGLRKEVETALGPAAKTVALAPVWAYVCNAVSTRLADAADSLADTHDFSAEREVLLRFRNDMLEIADQGISIR